MHKRIGALAVGAALLIGQWSAAAAFSIPDGYSEDGRLIMASEPGVADSDYVSYYQNGTQKSLEDITWVDGRAGHGKAVSLSGKDDFLEIGYNRLRLTNFSVSMWVNWKGASGNGSLDQRLMTIAKDKNNYIAVSPHHRDASKPDANGNIINGLFMDVTVEGNQETAAKASQSSVTTALPQNEWHHVAIVARQPYISLYVDGALFAQTLWNIGLRELNPNYMRIGGGMEGDASLNALVDDVEVYGFDLSGDQLLMLAAGVDPLAEGATVPSSTGSSAATQPTTTATTADPNAPPSRDKSLEVALLVGGCGLGIFVLLTAGSLIFGKKKPPAKPGGDPS